MLTLDDLVELFAPHGIDANNICRGGIRFDRVWLDPVSRSEGRDSPSRDIVLEVTSYARDENGERYMDDATGEAAIETRRFFTESLGLLTPCDSVGQQESAA